MRSSLATVATLAATSIIVIAGCRGTGTTPTPETATSSGAVANAQPQGRVGADPGHAGDGTPLVPRDGDELAAFAGGCFWGVEDVFRHVPGVVATAVGFTGGHTEHPTYPLVCTHTTGHAETVLVEFDPKKVSYDTLLNVFFKNHDPTTMNRQGPDVGDQYRSAVFTFSPEQDTAAHAAITREQASHDRHVVTEVTPMTKFWKAEDYHQQYDEKTGTHSCPLPNHGLPAGT
jgi:peptide-methionine (S)-S-oxide reductase